MPHDINLLRQTVTTLSQAGFQIAVFGGWAEELHGVSEARQHNDIDLLVIDANIVTLDAFVQRRGEIAAKRQTHKRAYTTGGVLVELFVVSTVDDQLLTNFWDSFVYRWPNLGPIEVDGLPVASVEALTAYRDDHSRISTYRP